MRRTHVTPGRKLLIQQMQDAGEEARKIRRGKRWGWDSAVMQAMVGARFAGDAAVLMLAIFRVEDQYGTTEGLSWLMPATSLEALQAFDALGLLQLLPDGRVTVVGNGFGDAYRKALLGMARREIPDNFDPTTIALN